MVSGTGIRVKGFGWTHAGRAEPALRDVAFHVEPGERILLCGDSGSGKSTLLAALAGVLGGDEEGEQVGEIQLFGADTAGNGEWPGEGMPVGLVLQDPDSQVISSRVGDDVAFGCENLGLECSEIWRRVDQALELVGLDLPRDYPTARLSGGQKQRLALAGVMAMGAGLILLDEPTANLDPEGADSVVRAVTQLVERTGATLIVVEHQPDRWRHLLQRGLLIEDGQVALDASMGEVLEARAQAMPTLPQARVPQDVSSLESAMWSKDLLTRFGPSRTFELPTGASTVVTGPNGAGKTTWLETMAGLLPYTSGEVGVAEHVRRGLKGDPATWKSRELAHRIGYVFQNPEHQFVARSVADELRVGPRVMGEEIPEKRIAELVERLRLGQLLGANPFTLSGGEKRRLSVATALVSAPAVLLLDEPTFGQDPQTFAELVWMLRELSDEGVTIASVTHDPLFIAALGDHRVEVPRA